MQNVLHSMQHTAVRITIMILPRSSPRMAAVTTHRLNNMERWGNVPPHNSPACVGKNMIMSSHHSHIWLCIWQNADCHDPSHLEIAAVQAGKLPAEQRTSYGQLLQLLGAHECCNCLQETKQTQLCLMYYCQQGSSTGRI